jgi:hypothetical protein
MSRVVRFAVTLGVFAIGLSESKASAQCCNVVSVYFGCPSVCYVDYQPSCCCSVSVNCGKPTPPADKDALVKPELPDLVPIPDEPLPKLLNPSAGTVQSESRLRKLNLQQTRVPSVWSVSLIGTPQSLESSDLNLTPRRLPSPPITAETIAANNGHPVAASLTSRTMSHGTRIDRPQRLLSSKIDWFPSRLPSTPITAESLAANNSHRVIASFTSRTASHKTIDTQEQLP